MSRPDDVIGNAEGWSKVAAAIRERRNVLGLTHKQASVASGDRVSTNVWSLLENSKQLKYRKRTLLGVAQALRWPDDTVEHILDGKEPQLTGARSSFAAAEETVTVPAGLARRLRDSTPDDFVRVEAYLDGVFAGRGATGD